jgi:hypothetical protein
MEAARNNSCVITIVGYHGNPVYRVVASIPIWNLWEVPMEGSHRRKYRKLLSEQTTSVPTDLQRKLTTPQQTSTSTSSSQDSQT